MAQNIISDIASEFMVGGSDEVQDVITFAESSWGLGLELWPVQRFMLKSLYGMELDNTERIIDVPDILNEKTLYNFTEREFLNFLYDEGRCNTREVAGKTFQELVLVMGRRASKSTCASVVSNYELYKLIKRGDPCEFFGFPPSTEIVVLNVAPTDGQAEMLLNMESNQAMNSPYLRDRNRHNPADYFDLMTDADIENNKSTGSILVLPGGCSASSLRGRNSIVVILDEMAFFLNKEDSRFSDSEVYQALTPSVASFQGHGKILCLSSPYAKFGRFYERFMESFDEPNYTLMFKMYTAMANPTVPRDILRTNYRRNKRSFMCEYGGEFSDRITTWIDDETEFRKCISDRRRPTKGKHDTPYFLGIDLGFTNDGSALAITHKEDGKILLDYADVWYSGSSDVWMKDDSIYHDCDKYADKEILKMADIVEEIKALNRWFPFRGGIFDQANGYGLWELLVNAGFNQFEMKHFTDRMNHDIYELTKRLYGEQLLDLYEHPVLMPEMLSLVAERQNKGKVIVQAPNREGAHDDISDALTRAIWSCYNHQGGRGDHIATGAGGETGTVGSLTRKYGKQPQTHMQAMMDKRKKHGEHPRGLDKIKKERK